MTIKRALKIAAVVVGVAIAVLLAVDLSLRPKVHRVVTPSGRAYSLMADLVSADGLYYIKYLSASSDPSDLEQGAQDLLALVSSDPRSRKLRTLTIEGNVPFGVRPFIIYFGYGYVFENRDGKWVRGDAPPDKSILRAGGAQVGYSRDWRSDH